MRHFERALDTLGSPQPNSVAGMLLTNSKNTFTHWKYSYFSNKYVGRGRYESNIKKPWDIHILSFISEIFKTNFIILINILNRVATGQENSGSGKSQGILCWVREVWDFEKSQGNSGKSLEGQGNLTFSCHTHNAAMPRI